MYMLTCEGADTCGAEAHYYYDKEEVLAEFNRIADKDDDEWWNATDDEKIEMLIECGWID